MRIPALLFTLLFLAQAASGQVVDGREVAHGELVIDTAAIVPGQPFTAGLLLKLAPGWHSYWKYSGDSGAPMRIEWKLPPGFKAGEIQWPVPAVHLEDGDIVTYGYDDEVLLMAQISPPARLREETVTLHARADWLVCEKLCVPGGGDFSVAAPVAESATPANAGLFEKYRLRLPKTEAPPFGAEWSRTGREVVVVLRGIEADSTVEFFPVPQKPIVVGHPLVERIAADAVRVAIPLSDGEASDARLGGVIEVSQAGGRRDAWEVESPPVVSLDANYIEATRSQSGLLKFLVLGFIGGFILNLMPCVLPVIALKMFGFIKQAGESAGKIFRLGMAFVAGIFAWFFGIAALVAAFKIAGRDLNWAFQFQNPVFITVMIVIIFFFALNMLGLFEIMLPSGANTHIVNLAGREGYRGAFLHGMFATLMATPCTAPFLGPALGFAFAQPAAIIFVMFGAIAAGMSFPYMILSVRPGWLRLLPRPGPWMVRLKQFMALLLLGTCVWLGWVLYQQHQSSKAEPFGPVLESALTDGGPVFVDFTADWCVNCKVNEWRVLNTEPVRQAFRDHNVRFLKADWTNGDPTITALLRQFGRAGVPLYVYYPDGRKVTPVVLPEIITKDLVIRTIEQGAAGD